MNIKWFRIFVIIFFVFCLFEFLCQRQDAALRHQLIKWHSQDDTAIVYTASDDPELIYEYKRNIPGFNSQGYPDKEHSFVKVPGNYRIIIIGDSIAVGVGASGDKGFSKVLENYLQEYYPNRKIEIIILARSGYALSQELRLLEKEALLYEPDIIIWSYCLNDPANPLYHFGNNDVSIYYAQYKSAFISYLSKKIFYLKENIMGWGKNKEYHQFLHAVYSGNIRSGIKQISNWSIKNSVPFIFYIHPVFSKDRKDFINYPYANIHDFLRMEATINNIPIVDGLDAFKLFDQDQVHAMPSRANQWFDPWHPNDYGHRLIAQQIKEYIIKSKLIKN